MNSGPGLRTHEVVVITGASAGVGRATARAFAGRGRRIALIARGRAGLDAARREVEARGGEALVLPADVADWRQVRAAAQRVVREWGGIDVWVNNAMVTVFGTVEALPPDDLQRVTEVTYLGAAFGTQAALEAMRPRNRGVIVQVGSALAYRAIPLQAAYCGAKHALRGFTDALRCELRHERSGIHLTMVQLSAFDTPQFDWASNLTGRRVQPVPPIHAPELAASAIVWAARHRRREVVVGWPALKAIVGNKLAPAFADRYLATHAYEGQLTGEPPEAGACANLREPCDAEVDAGARGRFAPRSRRWSAQWLLSRQRGWVAAAVATAGTLALLALAMRPARRARQ